MIDVDTFLTTLYVTVDDFRHSSPPEGGSRPPGPEASLSPSEVVTLALFAQWARFNSERDFYRYATSHLRGAFPTLPHRSQFNRLVRLNLDLIESLALHLAALLSNTPAGEREYPCCFEALDCSAIPVRDIKRRGEGWLAGYADIGWSNRLGWYEGFCLLVAADPTGVITGFGFSPASTKDQQLAETFFALRKRPDPRLASVGTSLAASGPCYYVVDKGFEGEERHQRWADRYGVRVVCPPKRNSTRKKSWPKRLRRWVAGLRQIVETVYEKLLNTFGLARERPHQLRGLRTRLAAKVGLHNFCIWLNEQLDRSRLAFADLLGW